MRQKGSRLNKSSKRGFTEAVRLGRVRREGGRGEGGDVLRSKGRGREGLERENGVSKARNTRKLARLLYGLLWAEYNSVYETPILQETIPTVPSH